ncbi:hypothetical protein RHODOSMS8_00537 [Rhodobiaceae bacterium]|nr:hypothetical protein RHODOSMS8_00537 [Rhodobiaceae bacterium]
MMQIGVAAALQTVRIRLGNAGQSAFSESVLTDQGSESQDWR